MTRLTIRKKQEKLMQDSIQEEIGKGNRMELVSGDRQLALTVYQRKLLIVYSMLLFTPSDSMFRVLEATYRASERTFNPALLISLY